MADPCSSSSMAGSASTSYSQNFQVFINHRGPDAKDTFATPLYRSLTQSGLLVFLDKPEMQVGHDIPSQIRAAIQGASLHVAILSPHYAESEWCLNELVLMIQSGKTIIPVFYSVKPSDLRWTGEEKNGPYARALYAHETKKRYEPQTIQQWRTALSRVANISGLELEAFNGEEEKLQRQEELLGKVVQSVLKIVPPPLDVAEYPTGLGGKLEEFESTVLSEHQREHRVGAKVVGLVGLGGIGKTTLARYFFNLKRTEYNMSSLLFDVRETAAKISLNSLQIKLVKQLKHRDIKIERWEEGKEILKNHLSSCHALIILDDVDHINHLDAFLPIKDVLHPNSLILVTSRNKGVLTSAKIVESSIYHLMGLTKAHSHQLFCSYAFSQPDPLPGYENLVYEFIEKCGGLPLSLKVLGALLCGENDLDYWKEMLDGLNKLHPDIENRLIVSYNSLNKEEQKIFLDIACFCIGDDRDKWIRIWGGSGWKGLVGFRNLQNKCLVNVNNENEIEMHDHLRDMGRTIAESSKSMPRRLWQPIYTLKDINDLLEESSPVITEVRGFRILKHFESRNHSRSHEVLVMRKLQLLEAQGDFVESILTRVESPKLIWLNWHDCPYPSLPSWISMHDLRVLEVHGYELKQLWESEREAPLQLRELSIAAPLEEFPKSLVQLKHLEKIVARNLKLAAFPHEFNLPSLKHLELQTCNFQRLWQCEYGAPLQLRTLIVYAPLVEFPKSLEQLQHLEKIVARNTSLEMFPKEFNMPSLKYLELSGCKFQRLWQCKYGAPLQLRELIIDAPLVEFPKSLGQMNYLGKIDARRTSPASVREKFNRPNLKYLRLDGFIIKASSMWGPLQELIIDGPFVEFPVSVGQLKHLERVVAKTSQASLPDFFGDLTNLRCIDLSLCESLEILPDSFGTLRQLKHLHLKGCCSLTISSETLRNITELECLDLSGCLHMELLPPQIARQQSLVKLNLLGTILKELPCALVSLSNLEVLRVGSPSLEVLPSSVGSLRNLKQLWLHECEKLQCLPDSVELLSELTELKIWKCGIQYLPPGVMKMSNLKVLAVCRCPLRKLPFCSSLELSLELPSINEGMIQLRELQLYRTEVLEVSFPEHVCPNLQDLRIVRCEHLVEVGALPTPLRNLDLGYCGELRKIRGIYGVTKLEKLDMRGCNNIEVEELQGLGTLIFSGLNLLRFQTEHFDEDSSIEQNVFSESFCNCCTT